MPVHRFAQRAGRHWRGAMMQTRSPGASGVLRTATLQSAMRADAQREEQYD
ncbi:MAG: hypothetical protein ACJ8NR_13055 [Sulfurifustis sp.]